MLELYINSGSTLIVEIQAWKDANNSSPYNNDWSDGHYNVMVGMI